ncbi:MAG: hypothetical protein FWD17_04605 [Polyangiaceae bacterium]|nr:hypothetical protein [Polyangiaceae bacterium]
MFRAAPLVAAIACGGGTGTPSPPFDAGTSASPGMGVAATPTDASSPAVAVMDAGPPTASPVLLASGQAYPSGIATNGTNVFWQNLGTPHGNAKAPADWTDGTIMECSTDGCGGAPTVLTAGRVESRDIGSPSAFAADKSAVYWGDMTEAREAGTLGDYVMRCSTDGCAGGPEVVGAPAVGPTWELAIDTTAVYFTNYAQVQVAACSLPGCGSTPAILWDGAAQTPSALTSGIAVDATDVYWTTENGEVMKCAKSGCGGTPTIVLSTAAGLIVTTQLALSDDDVYVVDSNPDGGGLIVRCPKTGCSGSPLPVATGLNSVVAVAVDASGVYWTEQGVYQAGTITPTNGVVRWCAVATDCGTTPITLASGLSYPSGIALDDRNVYFVETNGGRVWATPKAIPKAIPK